MEPRRLCSASTAPSAPAAPAALALHPDLVRLSSPASSASPFAAVTTVNGYTPAQIAKAYGFDQVRFNNGAVKGDGQGQTIAIIDAFDDPNIVADLGTFDARYNLPPPPDFKVVDQTGGNALPVTDRGWAGEISLDVEWAHAAAPGAKILLVEANSDSIDDLLAGVKYAAGAPGVSVVSMSWGGSEFFNFPGGEFPSETTYDADFVTPAGHGGVTFVAASGDGGFSQGVQWPAVSPAVLSVGGTSLNLASDGASLSESSWNGTSGGFSQIETVPAYQAAVPNNGLRASPDVAFDGNPNTGFSVYDSLDYQGYVGWQVVGGTSAGSPQWAALLAIADQGRALAGKTSLAGPGQTLPLLYGLYSAPGTPGYPSYAATFNDVADLNTRFNDNPALPGYDTATGLGSPIAPAVVRALGAATSPAPTPTPTPIPTPTPTPTGTPTPAPNPTPVPTPPPEQLPASPISAIFTTSPVGNVIGGQAGSARLLLANAGDADFSGPVTLTLYAATGSTMAAGDSVLDVVTLPQFNLRLGGLKSLKLKFTWPSTLVDGGYHVIASVDAVGTGTQPSQPLAPTSVTYAQPVADLATTFGAGTTLTVTPGGDGTAVVTIRNVGNVAASGTFSLSLYDSGTPNLDPSLATLLTSTAVRRISLKPGRSRTLRVRFIEPAGEAAVSTASAVSTYLVASVNSSTRPADNNPFNDVASIAM